MRFFREYNGFLIEFNSTGQFFRFLFVRLIGTIVGLALLGLLLLFLYWYGTH